MLDYISIVEIMIIEAVSEYYSSDEEQDNMAFAIASTRSIEYDEFICPVCQEFFDAPVRTCCNHL